MMEQLILKLIIPIKKWKEVLILIKLVPLQLIARFLMFHLLCMHFKKGVSGIALKTSSLLTQTGKSVLLKQKPPIITRLQGAFL